MISMALDNKNNLIVREGSIARVSEGAEIIQHVRSRILFYRGENYLNQNDGVPYFEEILIKPASIINVRSIFLQLIQNTPGVEEVLSYDSSFEPGTRKFDIRFSIRTDSEIINSEVTVNV